MQIQGKSNIGRRQEELYIGRSEFVLKLVLRAVESFDNFDDICPEPQPPVKTNRDNQQIRDRQSPNYQKKLEDYNRKRLDYMVLTSLDQPENEISWDTVDMSDPDTWNNYANELREAGFTESEIVRLVNTTLSVNTLMDEDIEVAKKRFLDSQEKENEENQKGEIIQTHEPSST